jgi:hypothetical protein
MTHAHVSKSSIRRARRAAGWEIHYLPSGGYRDYFKSRNEAQDCFDHAPVMDGQTAVLCNTYTGEVVAEYYQPYEDE